MCLQRWTAMCLSSGSGAALWRLDTPRVLFEKGVYGTGGQGASGLAVTQPFHNAVSSVRILHGLAPGGLPLENLAVEFRTSLLVIPAVLSDTA